MSFSNSLTELLSIRFPIMQAPIGSCSCPELAAAVSNAGGLGMMAFSWDSLESCRRKIASTLLLTKAPFGINLVLEWDQTEHLETCLDAGAPIVSSDHSAAGSTRGELMHNRLPPQKDCDGNARHLTGRCIEDRCTTLDARIEFTLSHSLIF